MRVEMDLQVQPMQDLLQKCDRVPDICIFCMHVDMDVQAQALKGLSAFGPVQKDCPLRKLCFSHGSGAFKCSSV